MWQVGLIVLIDRDTTSAIDFYADLFQPDISSGSLAARRVKQRVAKNPLSALESSANFSILSLFGGNDFFAQVQNHSNIAHMINQSFGNFLIDKIQNHRSLVDERNLNTQQRQHAGVFRADHSGSHND